MPWQTDQRKRDGHGASHGRNIADEADPRDRFAASVGCHSAKVLAHTLIPHANLRGTRFELKIDDYLFVGHPTETAQFSAKSAAADAGAEGGPAVEDEATLPFVFNLVLILKGRSKPVVVDAYYDLARRISAALVHEETRLGSVLRARTLQSLESLLLGSAAAVGHEQCPAFCIIHSNFHAGTCSRGVCLGWPGSRVACTCDPSEIAHNEDCGRRYLTKELKAMVIQPDLAPSTAQLVILGRSELAQTLRKVTKPISSLIDQIRCTVLHCSGRLRLL